jgi:hypothetical protein
LIARSSSKLRCALRIAFLTVGAVALQAIGGVDDQRLAVAGRA